MSETLIHIARAGYGKGFSNAFLVAALVAGIAANIVFWSMRRVSGQQSERGEDRAAVMDQADNARPLRQINR